MSYAEYHTKNGGTFLYRFVDKMVNFHQSYDLAFPRNERPLMHIAFMHNQRKDLDLPARIASAQKHAQNEIRAE